VRVSQQCVWVSQRTVALLAGHTLDVDDVLLAVHLDDLALTATVGAANHDDFVVLADWHGLNLRSSHETADGSSVEE